MASQHPASAAPRRSFAVPTPAQPPAKNDAFHGQEGISKLAARFITHLFACPDYPPTTTGTANQAHAKLPYFIAYALHRTKLHPSVIFASLILLQRLKARFPSARGSSGHRLFISAYMISSKVMCDDTYSNKSWAVVAQSMFTLREINQMEREMCNYLDWELTADEPILSNFESAVRRDFRDAKATYPNYPTTFVSKRAIRAEATSSTPFEEKSSTSSPIPSFSQKRGPPTVSTKNSAAPSTPTKSWGSNPNTPDTPSPSFSNATSPTSSGSPATPLRGPESNAKIRGVDASPTFGIMEGIPTAHPLKTKMFAFAIPSGW